MATLSRRDIQRGAADLETSSVGVSAIYFEPCQLAAVACKFAFPFSEALEASLGPNQEVRLSDTFVSSEPPPS